MSGFLSAAQGALDQARISGAAGFGWRSALRPASFRGAPFLVTEAGGEDGRRIALHAFPLRDQPFTEDLGRLPRRWRITGLVIGDAYFADRDALIDACAGQGSEEPGTLVHPFLGELRVRCESIQYTESLKEGRFCAFDLTFVEAGAEPSPTERFDTLRRVVATVRRVVRLAQTAYRLVAMARGDLVGFAQGVAFGFVQSVAGRMGIGFLALPRFDLGALRKDIALLSADPVTDPASVSETLPAPFSTLAAVQRLPAPAAPEGQALASRDDAATVAEPFDLLMAEARQPAPSSADAAEQEALLALHGLALDAAAAAAAEAATLAEWTNAQAALAARDALIEMLIARQDAAADAGQDDLFGAWRDLVAASRADLTERAARLPRVARYALPGPLPALALAQRLYGDAVRADEMVALARVPHPAVMPAEGPFLRP
jgi:prophage DNA circulation protein